MEKLDEMDRTSFDSLHWTKLTNKFSIFQEDMKCIVLCDDNNDYKMPHISKDKFERSG